MERRVSIGKRLTAGSSDVIYTVPKGYRAAWTLLYAINNTSSAKNFSAQWYDASAANTIHVFENYPLSAKNYIMFDGGAWVMLEEGDTITLSAETGSNIDAMCSFELERNNT